MKIKIDKEIIWRIKNLHNISIKYETQDWTDNHGIIHTVRTGFATVELDLSDDPDKFRHLEQLAKWGEIVLNYFSTSKRAYKVDIGMFVKMWPHGIEGDVVLFSVDGINYKPTWKDWFIQEDLEIAPKLST